MILPLPDDFGSFDEDYPDFDPQPPDEEDDDDDE